MAATVHSYGVGTTSMPAGSSESGGEARPTPISEAMAFRQLFDAQARYVWRCLLGFGVAESDVADASQQVFVVLHRKLDVIEPGCAIRTFIYGICMRVAADFRSRAHLRRERLYADPPDEALPPMQERQLSERQALQLLEQTLDRLDPAQRTVFVLYEIEEQTMPEIARTLGCPLQTAYSRLHAARRTVVAAMGDADAGED
jgi:RNA polymerase sigma-70 factor (ECF subfamily)